MAIIRETRNKSKNMINKIDYCRRRKVRGSKGIQVFRRNDNAGCV